jgi:hypothetical protein
MKYLSGFTSCNGNALADTIGAYFGQYSDQSTWRATSKNCSMGAVIADGRLNQVNGGTFYTTATPITTTCGTTIACTKGVLLLSDNSTLAYMNQIVSNTFNSVGNSIELAGLSANPPNNTKVGFNAFFSTTANCVLGNATNTAGECDGALYASGNVTAIQTNASSNTDLTGSLTLSSGTATRSFTGTYSTPPNCFTNDPSGNASYASTTSSVLTINGTGTDTVTYVCIMKT